MVTTRKKRTIYAPEHGPSEVVGSEEQKLGPTKKKVITFDQKRTFYAPEHGPAKVVEHKSSLKERAKQKVKKLFK